MDRDEIVGSSLDSPKRNRNRSRRRCGTRSATGPAESAGGKLFGYSRIYCKAWECPNCGPRKAKALCRRIGETAKERGLARFLTLTLDPSQLSETEEPLKYMRKVWSKFRVYLKREHGRAVSFISVVELHKSGVPHMHVLVDRYIPQRWISKAWSALGGGRIVYIERVKDLQRIGWYLGKYLTKDVILSAPRGTRRYTTSRDIKLGPKRSAGWRQVHTDMDWLRTVAGSRAREEVRDEQGRVKFFATEEPIAGTVPSGEGRGEDGASKEARLEEEKS